MGWVKFIKDFEDETWVIYKYSHDCEDFDGVVKVRKVPNLTDKDVYISPSKSDWKNYYFAYKVISKVNSWIKDGEELQESYMLAFG